MQIRCPTCGVELSERNLVSHLAIVHPKRKTKTNPTDPHQATLAFQVEPGETIYVLWENVWFEKDKLIFKNTKYALKPSTLKGVHAGLNLIREEFFLRLYRKKIYKLSHINGYIDQDRSRDWGKMISAIEIAILKHEFKTSRYSKIGTGITKQQLADFFNVSTDKEVYFKYLGELQSDAFPVIPILEVNSAGKEESIIFRFETRKGNVIIVWENVNDKRASHLFLTTKEDHLQKMEYIEDLILSDLSEKRAILHGGYTNSSTVKNQVRYLCNIMHTTMDDFQSRITNIIENY